MNRIPQAPKPAIEKGIIRGSFMGRSWDRECRLYRAEDHDAVVAAHPQVERWSTECLCDHILAVAPPPGRILRLVALGMAMSPCPTNVHPKAASSN